jgi:hypothetical protein
MSHLGKQQEQPDRGGGYEMLWMRPLLGIR